MMHGQTVCRMHGGKSPQALAKAEERLKALVHPALTGLAQLVANADSDSVRLSAIKDVLDRCGYRATDHQTNGGLPELRVTVLFDRPDAQASILQLPDGS